MTVAALRGKERSAGVRRIPRCAAMDFDYLKGFYYVAKLGSFTEAATRLYLTQPAISLQVKALERELGERLFDRIGRRIRLTAAGHILYAEAEALVDRLGELEAVVEQLKKLERGRLSIGASDTTSIYFLPQLLQRFLREHPGVELRLSSLVSSEVARRVLERELDVGIVTLPERPAGLEMLPLFEERFVAIASTDHALTARRSLQLRDLEGQRLVSLEPGSRTREVLDKILASEGVAARPSLELSNFEVIKRYVAAGLGVALVPEVSVGASRDGVAVIRLARPIAVTIGVVFRKDRKLSHAARAFLEMVCLHFGASTDAAGTARPESSTTRGAIVPPPAFSPTHKGGHGLAGPAKS